VAWYGSGLLSPLAFNSKAPEIPLGENMMLLTSGEFVLLRAV
jgi:hypothetical protein